MVRDDLEFYLTSQPIAVGRYGSSLHDLERYQKQLETLGGFASRLLESLKGYPEAEIPEPKAIGLE